MSLLASRGKRHWPIPLKSGPRFKKECLIILPATRNRSPWSNGKEVDGPSGLPLQWTGLFSHHCSLKEINQELSYQHILISAYIEKRYINLTLLPRCKCRPVWTLFRHSEKKYFFTPSPIAQSPVIYKTMKNSWGLHILGVVDVPYSTYVHVLFSMERGGG